MRVHPEYRLWLALLLVSATVAAQETASPPAPPQPTLGVDEIFGSGVWNAAAYGGRWLPDSRGYVRKQGASGPDGGQDLVLHDPATGKTQVLVSASQLTPGLEAQPLTIDDYAFSDDLSKVLIYTNSQRVWRQNTRGDYWVLDRTSRELRQLGGKAPPPSSLMFAKFSPDGRWVAYVREHNIYVESADGVIPPRALTSDGSETIINGTFDWVYEEELGLQDGFVWSPDGRSIAYWQLDTEGVRRFPLVNNTAGLYPTVQWIPYPKTGERNSAARIGVVDVHEQGATRWMDSPGDPRENYAARLQWIPDSRLLLLQQLNRLQNQNSVFLLHADDGTGRLSWVEHDDAWVEIQDALMWGPNQTAAWLSESSGKRSLYLASWGEETEAAPGRIRRILGDDGPEIMELQQVDAHATGFAYFLASPGNATQQYLYRVSLSGDQPAQRVTPADQIGTHQYQISPDGRWALHTWSTFDTPPRTELVRLPGHEVVRSLEENQALRDKLAQLGPERPHSEMFAVDIGDGVMLDAWCIRPAKLEDGKKYPLLVHVYGEPAGQTVLDRWGGSTYLWHCMLAQQGYVVMSFDNRGTPAAKGREWRKSVHHQIGILAPRDQAAAVEAMLSQRSYLDRERVGVWGWSGGGSMTLHAMFKYPDLYHVGVSVAPVPNERLYDTIYQERYMGLPSEHSEAYIQGSALNFAHQLKGSLLLVHGAGDDNCHYQGMEMLINELVRQNKSFQMMAYPNRTHSIREGVNTTLHLRSLMTHYLQSHLPPGPK